MPMAGFTAHIHLLWFTLNFQISFVMENIINNILNVFLAGNFIIALVLIYFNLLKLKEMMANIHDEIKNNLVYTNGLDNQVHFLLIIISHENLPNSIIAKIKKT